MKKKKDCKKYPSIFTAMSSLGITASVQRASSSYHPHGSKKQWHKLHAKSLQSFGTKQATHVVTTSDVEGHHKEQNVVEVNDKSGFLTEKPTVDEDESREHGRGSESRSFPRFSDERWKNGTWDLNMFVKNGKMDWDAVIVAGICVCL